jgi:hypothetical protein
MGKKDVLSRYAQTEDGRIVIDVAADRVEDLYNDFDKRAPYMKKDLDQELVDYLIDCALEIGKKPFSIRINLPLIPGSESISRVRESIQRFFEYLEAAEHREMRKILRTSFILLAIGMVLIVLSIWFNRAMASSDSVVAKVFSEGLTIAAWVSFWEALATFLIQWPSRRGDIGLYRRLADSHVEFQVLSSEHI